VPAFSTPTDGYSPALLPTSRVSAFFHWVFSSVPAISTSPQHLGVVAVPGHITQGRTYKTAHSAFSRFPPTHPTNSSFQTNRPIKPLLNLAPSSDRHHALHQVRPSCTALPRRCHLCVAHRILGRHSRCSRRPCRRLCCHRCHRCLTPWSSGRQSLSLQHHFNQPEHLQWCQEMPDPANRHQTRERSLLVHAYLRPWNQVVKRRRWMQRYVTCSFNSTSCLLQL
jgi:hypothetical protein